MESNSNQSYSLTDSSNVSRHDALENCVAVDANMEVAVTLDAGAQASENGETVEHDMERVSNIENDVERAPVVEDDTEKLPTCIDPFVGMEFKTENDAKMYYNDYARREGFSTRVGSNRRSKVNGKIIGREFLCSKEGFRSKKYQGNRPTTREGCKARMLIRKLDSGNWVVAKVVNNHNHPLVSPNEVHLLRSHKRVIEERVPSSIDPFVGMEFKSENDAKICYNDYGLREGFSTRVGSNRRSKINGKTIGREFLCSRQGFRSTKYQGNRPVTRQGCKARMLVRKLASGNWIVSKLVTDHNHLLVSQRKVHLLRSHKHVRDAAKNLPVTPIISEVQHGGPNNILQDPINYLQQVRKQILGEDVLYIVQYFQRMQAMNPFFFYAVQVDEENRLTNVFWVDARSRMANRYFGDVVTFDTTYRMDWCGMPFASFVGVNNHKQSILFGCAILLVETEASFVWLFKTWLQAMSGHHPKSIITDQDAAIGAAVTEVFPKTHHHFCKWHILRKFPEKLGDFECKNIDFRRDFYKCINITEPDEFESCWKSFTDKYEVGDDQWIKLLYNTRKQWVQVYLLDSFFANMCTMQHSESINPFFDGYVDKSATLRVFVNQCQSAIDSHYEKQLEEELKTSYAEINMKTGLPMEEQALEIYTRTIFFEFQEQLFQSITHVAEMTKKDGPIRTFRVADSRADARAYTVTFNVSKVRVSCSCQMFEYAGILCRHALVVFKMENVTLLPPHYFLKRWARNAATGTPLDDHNSEKQIYCKESRTSRYNDLCNEAIRCAAHGAMSKRNYKMAVLALSKALEEIVAAKENDATVFTHQTCPDILQDNNCEGRETNTLKPKHFPDPCPTRSKGYPKTRAKMKRRRSKIASKPLEETTKRHQKTRSKPSLEDQVKKKQRCAKCNQPDHCKSNCPNLTRE